MKKLITLFVSFAIIISTLMALPVTAQAYTIEKTINLYVREDWCNDKVVMSKNFKQKYQFDYENATYSVVKGDSVTVSKKGLVKYATTTYYWNGNIGSTVSTGADGEVKEESINYGKSVVLAKVGSKKHYFEFNVKSYGEYYADKVIDKYIAKNFKDGMSDKDIVDKITAFPAQYDYSVHSQSYVGLISGNGGDCWASTNAICEIAKRLGYKSHARYGANDGGAGSGHRNAVIMVGGQCYVCEAGYSGTAPRFHNYYCIGDGRVYTVNQDGETASLSEYSGFRSSITIAKTYQGKPVTSIAKNVFYNTTRYSGVKIKSVTLPSTLTEIQDGAFSSTDITSINIPASVTSIGDFVFSDCEKLTAINVDSGNKKYKSVKGVLYNKSGNTLVSYPGGKTGNFTLPSKVTTIKKYAFYYVKALPFITAGANLKTIQEGAFGDSSIKGINFKGDMPAFEDYALYYCPAVLYYPKGNKTWKASKLKSASTVDVTMVPWSGGKKNLTKLSVELDGWAYDFTDDGYRYCKQVKVMDGKRQLTSAEYTTENTYTKFGDFKQVKITGNGMYSGTVILLADGSVKAPAVPTVTSLKAGKANFTATVKKVSYASGYQLQYSTSAKFTKETTKTVKFYNSGSLTQTVKKLKSGKKYYIRVRTFKTANGKNVYSKWSTAKAVKIK